MKASGKRVPRWIRSSRRPACPRADRSAFLDRFSRDNPETLVGFAVMGGIFGEGIDLVGERLSGAVIVGVGLPGISLEKELIRDYYETALGAGFEFAYMYPGINRVLQAAGRVIRSESDRGVVLLIDQRFGTVRYHALFPSGVASCGTVQRRRFKNPTGSILDQNRTHIG
jgi:DNA excision repair protein ERCC-2